MTPEEILKLRRKYLHECRQYKLKINAMYEFTDDQYQEFKTFLRELNKVNWGVWDTRQWLRFPGLPSYSIHQYEQTNGKTFVVVKFDEAVKLPYDRKGKRFKIDGGMNYQPVCERF